MPLPLLDAVRLLRHDVLQNFKASVADANDDQRFLLWWALSGHREYPAANDWLPADAQRRWLFEPVAASPQRGGLGMNRLLLCLYAHRPTVHQAFDIGSPVGLWDAVSWFYVVALRELGLEAFLDSATRAALNAPAFDGPGPQPTWLMTLLWRQQPALQRAWDLTKAEGRQALVHWFTTQGAQRFGLQPLLQGASAQAAASAACAPSQRGGQQPAPFGVNLVGFAYGELGIGEDLRMAARACEAADIPFKVLNINPGQHLRQADRHIAAHVVEDAAELPYAINLFCLTGFDTVRAYAERGPALFAGRYNIGWWPWELPVWPRRWQPAFEVVDEIWAATRFTQEMFSKSTAKPVTLMPLPVSVERMKKTSRRSLGLPAKRFLFLYIFDFNSYLDRKNPEAVIDAFQRAFPDDGSVGLVLKTMNSRGDNPAWEAFTQRCAADPRIVLLQRTLDREVVLGLVNACDAYVSLHRSEGFGRTLAEAMLLCKPVVGTGFSGNADFLTKDSGYPVKWKKRPVAVGEYPFIEAEDGAWWAEPDVAHAARQMRAARSAAGSEWALQLPQQMHSTFAPASIGTRMAQALRERFDALQSAQAEEGTADTALA
ncbi:glycosyltransferase [Azohydromonas lata]|uniref:glycosyltransferase n=1 Tax=Azohydromonas lata TaxID=45677 RepID=UPI000830C22F|nr:glycosyltransferase [Azohydromonas lata]